MVAAAPLTLLHPIVAGHRRDAARGMDEPTANIPIPTGLLLCGSSLH